MRLETTMPCLQATVLPLSCLSQKVHTVPCSVIPHSLSSIFFLYFKIELWMIFSLFPLFVPLQLGLYPPQFHRYSVRSVSQSCPTLHDPMDHSMPGLPVHHQLPEFTQTHLHWVDDAIQPSHLLSSPSPPAIYLSQHQGLFKWASSLHQMAKVLEFYL